MTRNPRAGFSFLEFSICLLLIGGMVACILRFGNYSNGRAHMASCSSNIRQLTLAMSMYCTDNGGRGPTDNVPVALYPYMKNWYVFTCPANPDQPKVVLDLPPEAMAEEDFLFPKGFEGDTDKAKQAAHEPEPFAIRLGYQFRSGVWSDDSPRTIIVQDISATAHAKHWWLAGHLDGSSRRYPATDWQPID